MKISPGAALVTTTGREGASLYVYRSAGYRKCVYRDVSEAKRSRADWAAWTHSSHVSDPDFFRQILPGAFLELAAQARHGL
jgi:hypothetical protein